MKWSISNSDALNTYDIGEFYVIAPNLNTINWNLKKFENVMKSKKRVLCAPPAPSQGLFLTRIIY